MVQRQMAGAEFREGREKREGLISASALYPSEDQLPRPNSPDSR
jgi:hypothetical protein